MDGETYIKNVLRTESTDFDAVRERLTDNCIRLDHMAHGIMTEISELFAADQDDYVNLVEELGDVTWYISGALDVLRCWDVRVFGEGHLVRWDDLINYSIGIDGTINGALRHMTIFAGELLDQLKKHLFYGRPLDVEVVIFNLREVVRGASAILAIINAQHGKAYTLEDVWDVNIAKLEKRYDKKFSEDAANNRDLEAERAVLEDGTEGYNGAVCYERRVSEEELVRRYKLIASKELTPKSMAEAIEYLTKKAPVTVSFSDESGEPLWVISPVENPGFWLEGFSEQEEALEWCEMYQIPVEKGV